VKQIISCSLKAKAIVLGKRKNSADIFKNKKLFIYSVAAMPCFPIRGAKTTIIIVVTVLHPTHFVQKS